MCSLAFLGFCSLICKITELQVPTVCASMVQLFSLAVKHCYYIFNTGQTPGATASSKVLVGLYYRHISYAYNTEYSALN